MIHTITISPAERDAGALGGETIKEAQRAFRADGVMILNGIVDASLIAEAREKFTGDLDAYINGEKGDCVVKVGEMRLMITVDLDPPFGDARLFANPWLMQVLAALLGKDFVIDAFGVVCSLPGAPAQQRHHDGGVLFGESGLDRMLPTTAVTVAIPLLEMNETTGTTAVWPGSRTEDAVPDTPPEEPVIAEGACILWDFRTRHRGMPNRGSKPRPLLYITYCRPWWLDHLNFAEQTRKPLRVRKPFRENLTKDQQWLLSRAQDY